MIKKHLGLLVTLLSISTYSFSNDVTVVDVQPLEPKVIGWNSIGDGWAPFPDVDQGEPIYDPAGPSPVPSGSKAKLKRKSNEIEVSVNTKGLEPGAYTSWLIVIGDSVKAFFGDGTIVKNDGKGRFKFSLEVGETRESIAQAPDDAFMASLVDLSEEDRVDAINNYQPYFFEATDINQQMFVVIKWHGPVSPQNDLWEQTHTVQGECVRFSARDLAFRHPLLGKVGKEMCYDPQIATFPAVP